MNYAEQLQMLGEATARGHQLELVLAGVLARVLMIDDSTARLLATTMGISSTLNVLHELTRRKVCGQVDEASLKSWLGAAKYANEARNRVVHSPWVRGDGHRDVDALSVVAKRSMELEPRSRKELHDDIDALAEAVAGANKLLQR